MTASRQPFTSPYRHGFLRVAAAVPRVALADPARNAGHTLELARRAAEAGAGVVIFPELGLSAYSVQDLVQQQALLAAVLAAVEELLEASRELAPVLVVGAPLAFDGRLFNCAVAIYRGRVLGVVPKTYLPNYREFYEVRHFAPAVDAVSAEVTLAGQRAPFGNDLIFTAAGWPDLALHVEICEDLWVPVPPSSLAALGGATVLANLSASNVTIAKADYRRLLCAAQSGRCLAAYLYTAAGFGESTTDLAWDGHAMVWENGRLLAESERFADEPQLVIADVDLERLAQERLRTNSFAAGVSALGGLPPLRRVEVDFEAPQEVTGLHHPVSRFPFVPTDPARRDERCHEAYEIQVQGLVQRLTASGIDKVVVGVSGGLDSTQALLVAVRAVERLGLPVSHVLAYTLPGFATSQRTRDSAWRLMRALGVSAAEIDIRPSATQMLADLGHPAASGEPVHDRTYENVQAGERTSHLFRLANHHDALVVGTGDLSELALGWTTYGVGDQMSHYNVNASVPKTLVRHLISWVAQTRVGPEVAEVLRSILGTEISPELVPGDGDGGQPAQRSEEVVGPYELQDFHLYYLTRYGFRPSKIAFLAHQAWGDAARGPWPESIPADERRAYTLPAIKRWLGVFLRRFFAAQFKRSAMPDGPKVGSGGSLSPRGDWRSPSDASARAWLAELEEGVPAEIAAPEGNARA